MMALAVLGALGAFALSEDSPAESTILPEIWVIGDSIGVGIASAMVRANMPHVSRAIISTTARQWLTVLRAPDYGSWPQGKRLVVVSLGTNDAQSVELRREFISNALAIVAELRARGHVVCWVLPPSASSLIPQPGDFDRLLEAGATPLWTRVPMADTWHPTATGYDELAAAIEHLRRNPA